MDQIKLLILFANFALFSFCVAEFDLPVAKIYEVDENDQILGIWDKVVKSEAVIEGVDSLRLECTANHPVQWIYSGNGIPVSSSKIIFSRNRVQKELETVYKASLFINPLKEHHTGKYQCSSTEVLDQETFFYIYVPGQALFTSLNGKNIHIPKNDSKIVIPCSVSNPKISVTLEKQVGHVLQAVTARTPESIVYDPREGFTVKLNELTEEAEGIFVCTAKYNNLVRGVEYTIIPNHHLNPHDQPESSSEGCTKHTCGDNAICTLVGGKPTCQCEEMFIGDADSVCSLKCDSHTDCPDNKSCFTDKECRSPCLHSVTGCGINSLCKVENHRPVCYCGPDFIGDPMQQCFTTLQDAPASPSEETPSNDSPAHKCKSNDDCKIDEQCRKIGNTLECVDGCQFVQCGLNSKCSMANHNPHCSCQEGFNGDPYSECTLSKVKVEPITTPIGTPCENPEKCGPYGKCRVNKRGRERCFCKDGALGQYPNCTPYKCEENKDCLPNQVCSNITNAGSPICLNVCGSKVCGENAECVNPGQCRCPVLTGNFVGDPYIKCTDISLKLDQECVIDNDCGGALRCETGASYRKCVDPCEQIKCSVETTCITDKHEGSCVCPHGFTGNQIIGCTPDFNVDGSNFGTGRSRRVSADCTTLSCGLNSECRLVEGEPTCFCQSGFVGKPPSCRSECLSNIDCSEDRACIRKRCRSPCVGKCGENTKCKVVPSLERTPVCSCEEGFEGNPNVGCRRAERFQNN